MKRWPFAVAEDAFQALCDMYDQDIANASNAAAEAASESAALYVLSNAAWARRVSGVFANLLVHREPGRAHAVAVPAADGSLTISVRAPLERPQGAAALCLQFPSGGGRERAAGINDFPAQDLDRFATAFLDHFRAAH